MNEQPRNIQVLLVEDSADDALLTLRQLKQGGFAPDHVRVDTRAALEQALRERAWDIVLCDYKMPGFNGAEALTVVQQSGQDIPFILISGTIGEETAVALMKAGAHDFLLKDALGRLVPAVERELREAEVRRDKRRKEAALLKSEANLKKAELIALLGNWEWNIGTNELLWSDEVYRIYGMDPARDTPSFEVVVRTVAPEDRDRFVAAVDAAVKEGKPFEGEYRMIGLDGTVRYTHTAGEVVRDSEGRPASMFGIVRDISKRKLAEEAQRVSEERFRSIFNNIGIGISLISKNMEVLSLNPQMQKWFPQIDSSKRPVCYRVFNTPPREAVCEYCPTAHTLQDGTVHVAVTDTPTDGGVRHYQIISTPLLAEDGTVEAAIEMVEDVTERRRAEDALRVSEERLSRAQAIAHVGDWEWDLATNAVHWSDELYRIYGFEPRSIAPDYGLVLAQMHPDSKDAFLQAIDGARKEDRPFEIDYRFFRKGGTEATLHTVGQVIRDAAGAPVRMIGIVQDLTEQQKAEVRLRESEDKFRTIFESATDGIMIADIATKTNIEANKAMCAMMGYARDEILGLSVESIHPQGSLPGVMKEFERQLRGEITLAEDIPMLRKDGSVFYADVNAAAITLGGRRCLIGIFRDITERRQAAAALKKREQQLAESQRIAHVGSWEHNPRSGEIFWSDELFRLLGLDPVKDRADFGTFFSRIHPDDQPILKAAVDASLREKKPFDLEYRIVIPGEPVKTIHARADLLPDATGDLSVLSGTGQDITERKLAADKLSEKNTMLLTLINAIPDQVFFKDSRGRYLLVNKAMEKTLGIGQEKFVGMTDDQLSPPDVAAQCKRSDAEAIRRGGPVYSEESYVGKDGMMRFLDVVKSPIHDAKGDLQGLVVVSRDITVRKQVEGKIRESETFIRSILDTVDEGFIVIDRDYRITTANRAYCGQVSLPCDDIIGKHCYEISHRTNRPCYEAGEECAVRSVFETGESHAVLHKHADKDGHILFVETKAFPIKDASGTVVSAIETISNITEKHLLEEERLKTQKLESIGILAGGIAHDFNNLLQGVFGYISMAKMMFDERDKSLAMLEQAEKAVHQSVNLTSQLLTFSKGGKPVKQVIDLKPVLEDAAKFALSGSRSGFRIDIEPGLWQVDADGGQVGQVIQNIVLNADQAMPLGGRVTIAARNLPASEAAAQRGLERRDHIMISIADQGVGIPENCLDKIFDPYFTTKDKGSGLGLATSYSIIRNHNGRIEVTSEAGKGTTFCIYLPAVRIEASAAVERSQPALKRQVRVLLMDDEELICKIARELLGILGHTVEFAGNGDAAIEKYRQAKAEGRPFDRVILDLTVRGGKGGAETLRELLELDPGVSAIVSSGYSDDEIIATYRQHGFRAFLKKPYTIEDLNRALADAGG